MQLSSTATNLLNDMFTAYVDASETENTKRMHPSADSIELVIKELKIKTQDISSIRIEESKNPIAVPVHADTPKGYITTLVPLGYTGVVSTVLFTSYYHGTNTAGYKYRPTNKQYYKDEWLSTDHQHVDNLTDNNINRIDHQTHLSFLEKEDLCGLTVEQVIPWQLSQVMQFPSNQLHSGSTFTGSKRWLLIVSAIS